MSRAAQKLIMDDAWHPSATSPHSWYRVWHRRLIQRAQFENEQEEQSLFPMLDRFEPIEERSGSEGFREQLVIELADDAVVFVTLLGYPLEEKASAAFDRAIALANAATTFRDGLLFLRVTLDELTHEQVTLAEESAFRIKLFYQALAAGSGFAAAEAAYRRSWESEQFGM